MPTAFFGKSSAAALTALTLTLYAVPMTAQASDPVASARTKAETLCAACHGKDGNTPIDPSYPRLAGQYRDYLERTLLDYLSGARKNAIMGAQVQGLSRAEISALAAYYSAMPGDLRVRRP